MAGERLGPATAVRSSALSPGRAPSFGSIEARFGPVLPAIGFTSRSSSPEVKVLSSLPFRNNIPEVGRDSSKPKPVVTILGTIRSGIPEVAHIVNRTIKFAPPPAVEAKSNIPQFLDLSPRISGVEPVRISKIAHPFQAKPSIEVRKPAVATSEAVKPTRLLEQQIFVSRVMANIARTRALLRPQVKTVADPEAQPLSQPQTRSQAGVESATSIRVQTLPGTEVQTIPDRATKTGIRQGLMRSVRGSLDEQSKRKRYLQREEDINDKRKEVLIKANDELEAADPENANGEKVVARANLLSEANGSTLLVQMGNKKRREEDGGLHRLARFLGALQRLDKEKIAEGVKEFTAVKLTYEQPYNPATTEEGEIVLRPPQSPFSEGLPESFFEEISEKKTSIKTVISPISAISEGVPIPVNNEAKVPAEEIVAMEPEVFGSANYVKATLDSLMYIGEVFQPMGIAEINRRELVLAE